MVKYGYVLDMPDGLALALMARKLIVVVFIPVSVTAYCGKLEICIFGMNAVNALLVPVPI